MINSSSNNQIKNIMQLNTKSKYRKKENSFVCEGIRLFEEIPSSLIRKVYVSEDFFNNKKEFIDKNKDFEIEVVENKLFNKISDTKTPQGILTIVKIPCYNINSILKSKNPLLLFLEDLQDPGNLGTIIRTSEGAGVDGIIMTKNCVDFTSPKVIRSTMGSIFRVPLFLVENSEEVFKMLKENNITSYATSLNGKKFYNKANYKSGSCIFIGNEGNGISEHTLKMADELIKIPMKGKVESLNAAMATGIIIYEAMMQRL